MSKKHFLIDNGHGGLVDGEYVTAPKKMYEFEDGLTVHEGVFNRAVAAILCDMLMQECIDYHLLVPEDEDIPLPERVERANDLYDSYKGQNNPYVLISIHGNAGKGTGDEIWTSRGETESDRLVSNFAKGYRNVLEGYGRKFRADTTDGDVDKEASFYILKHTKCPAFLTENGFFDNRKEAEFMISEEGQMAFAMAHFKGIRQIENYSSEY